jgi:hypothetical protein
MKDMSQADLLQSMVEPPKRSAASLPVKISNVVLCSLLVAIIAAALAILTLFSNQQGEITKIRVKQDQVARRQAGVNAENIKDLQTLLLRVGRAERKNRRLIHDLQALHATRPDLFSVPTRHAAPTPVRKPTPHHTVLCKHPAKCLKGPK